jgi:hypothetical protein
MITRSESDSAQTWLVNLPTSPRQNRISFLVAIALIAGLGATAPFADVQLPRLDAFIPAAEIAVIITDFITAVLLFSQARIYHSRAVFAVASGYLFTALIVIPHVLTFPGAFAPTGLWCGPPKHRLALHVLASCFPHEHVGLCMPERRKAYRASHTDVVCSSVERGNGNYFGFCNYMARDRRRSISATAIFRRYPR